MSAVQSSTAATPAVSAGTGRIHRMAWLPLLSQCVGMIAGVLLTRLLPKAEFAWFTIGNTVVSFFSTLIEGGGGLGMQSIGGRMRQEPAALRQLVTSTLRCRWKLGGIAAIIALPVPIWLLLRNEAPVAWTALLITVNAAAFPLIMTGGILAAALKLTGEFRLPLQADLAAAFARLALVLVLAFFTLNAVLAALAATAALLLQNRMLAARAQPLTTPPAEPSAEYQAQLSRQFRALLPNGVFMFLQTQVGVWVLSLTASVSVVADFGALARLASLFALVSVVFYQLVIPGLAGCQSAPELRRRLWQSAGLFLLATTLLVTAGAWFARPILFIFGPAYGHLVPELPWMLLCHGVYTWCSILWWFNTSRGWVLRAWLNPLLTILVQALVLLLFRPGTLMALIVYLFLTILPSLFIALAEVCLGLRRLPPTDIHERVS